MSAGTFDPQIDSLLDQYARSGSIEAFGKALNLAQGAAATPGAYQVSAAMLYASLLIARGQRTRSPEDFSQALEQIKRVRAIERSGSDLDLPLLIMECAALSERAARTGSTPDLDRVIAIGRSPKLRSADPDMAASFANYFGSAWLSRFHLTRNPSDLDQALVDLRAGRDLTRDPMVRAALANNLAVALHERYEFMATESDLTDGLDLTFETARELETCGLPPELTDGARIGAAVTRASLLASRWRLRADQADLSEARTTFRRVLKQMPADHPMLAGAAAAYASLAVDLAITHRDSDAASAAVMHCRMALEASAADTIAHASAATSLAVALQARWEVTGSVEDLDEAILLQQDLEVHPKLANRKGLLDHNLGVLLASRFQATHNRHDIDESIRRHRSADRSPTKQGADGDLMEIRYASSLVLRYLYARDESDARHAIELLKSASDRPGTTIRRVQGLRLLAELAELTDDCELAERAVHRTLKLVESVTGALDTRHWNEWLLPIQGLTAVGAIAAARLGHFSRAVRFLERGCAVRASAHLAQQSATLAKARRAGYSVEVDAYVLAATEAGSALNRDSSSNALLSWPAIGPGPSPASPLSGALGRLSAARQNLEAKVGPLAGGGSVVELLEFVETDRTALDYLIAGTRTGARLRLASSRPSATQTTPTITVDWLPELTTANVETMLQRLHPEPAADRPAMTPPSRVLVRGSIDGPTAPTIQRVIDQLGRTLHAQESNVSRLRIVPVGKLSLLPLQPALANTVSSSTVVTSAGSGQLHRMAARNAEHSRPSDPPRIAAITNPQPCHWGGVQWPSLPGAEHEGLLLEQDYGAHAYSGREATAEALVRAFSDPDIDLVHLASHGTAGRSHDELVRILLADNARGQASTVTEQDLPPSLTPKVVFLAACWLGQNSTSVPDESAGFATWLLQAGASATVAPLWAVDDAAAVKFVSAFYRHWTSHPKDVSAAVASARAELVGWAQNSAVATQAQRDAALCSAYAFVVSGS